MNPGVEFDSSWVDINPIDENGVKMRARHLLMSRVGFLDEEHKIAWLLKAISCIDLTTLAGDDTEANVTRLCHQAIHPLHISILDRLNLGFSVSCAAVCVYPARVKDAALTLKNANSKLSIASVATGFPAGQTFLNVRLQEIRQAVEDGATEIDVVINRRLAILHDWENLYLELNAMRDACGEAHMKTILAVGELSSFTEVYQASMVAMMAGSDFIKTSTGKEAVNATIPVGIVMCRAIKDYFSRTGMKIGLKPAGGLRVAQDAISWLILIKEELGDGWLNSELFRIGASGLLTDIEKEISKYAHKISPN